MYENGNAGEQLKRAVLDPTNGPSCLTFSFTQWPTKQQAFLGVAL